MAKITYVPTWRQDANHKPLTKISFKRLGEIFKKDAVEIETEMKDLYGDMWKNHVPFAEGIQCPFGERDLMDDTCYIGSGVHRCPYFLRYVHEGEHSGTIECCCQKPRIVTESGEHIQLTLFDLF